MSIDSDTLFAANILIGIKNEPVQYDIVQIIYKISYLLNYIIMLAKHNKVKVLHIIDHLGYDNKNIQYLYYELNNYVVYPLKRIYDLTKNKLLFKKQFIDNCKKNNLCDDISTVFIEYIMNSLEN